MDVGMDTMVTVDGIWWQITGPAEGERNNFDSICVVPGTYFDPECAESIEWDVGGFTTWDNETVEHDHAMVVALDEVPDEVLAAIAKYALLEGEN